MTKDVEHMLTMGIKDIESLETYLEAEFDFDGFHDCDSLKELFGCLLLHYPIDDVLPAPVDAEINYDGENTMSIGLSVYVNVFDYKQANMTFKNFFAKLSKIETLRQVVDILQSVSSEASKILEYLAAGREFKVTLWQDDAEE